MVHMDKNKKDTGLSNVEGVCLAAIVIVVLFTCVDSQTTAWTVAAVDDTRSFFILTEAWEQTFGSIKYIAHTKLMPCVLLTRFFVLCQSFHLSTATREDWWLFAGPKYVSWKSPGNFRKRKLKHVNDYKGFYVANDFEEDFRIFLGELEEPFEEDSGIVPILLVRRWPPSFHVDDAVFMAYETVTTPNNSQLEALYVKRTLISAVACYARMSRWTVACLPHDERRGLCWIDGDKNKVTPESIILVQGAFFGFFADTWDRFGWRCTHDQLPYDYGTAMLSIASLIPWIQNFICSEAVVLLPLDLPYIQNFSSGVNPHMRGTGSTFVSELYGEHGSNECCNGCTIAYDARQFMLMLAICTFLARL